MQAGVSWEGVSWRSERNALLIEPTNQLRVGAALLLFALLASVLTGATLAWAAPADAAACNSTARNPYKSGPKYMRGSAKVSCTAVATRSLYVGVYRNINNFPDPKVCGNNKTDTAKSFVARCGGRFANAGRFYTYAEGAGGRDYSQFIYFQPG
jgi:hypothetical protein